MVRLIGAVERSSRTGVRCLRLSLFITGIVSVLGSCDTKLLRFRLIVGTARPPVDAGAGERAVVVLREGKLAKGGIHLTDTPKVWAVFGSGVPREGRGHRQSGEHA